MKFMKNQFNKDTIFAKLTIFAMKMVLKTRRNPQKIYDTLKSLGLEPAMRVLDYGAGIGSYAFEAAKIVGPNGNVIAADISETMIAEIETEIAQRGYKNIKAQKINNYTDITQSEFDFILLIDVLHMMDEQVEAIQFLLKKLSPTGKIVLELDHMNNSEIAQLLNSVNCQCQKIADEHCWLLYN